MKSLLIDIQRFNADVNMIITQFVIHTPSLPVHLTLFYRSNTLAFQKESYEYENQRKCFSVDILRSLLVLNKFSIVTGTARTRSLEPILGSNYWLQEF